jgi:hypothetical protein
MRVKLLNDYLVIYRDIQNLIVLKMEKRSDYNSDMLKLLQFFF